MADGATGNLPGLIVLLQPLVASLPRIGAALLVLPLLPPSVVPQQLRAGVAISLALVVWPTYAAQTAAMTWDFGGTLGYLLKEVLIGALIGYAMGVMIWALGCVGELIDVQVGFNNAQIFEPFSGHPGGPVARLLTQLGVLLFISVGGLHVFLQLLYESIVLWPPDKFYPQFTAAWRDMTIARSGTVLEWATRWATPVIAALLVVELGIGLINRVAQQFNSFYFAMPVKALTAVLVLGLLVAHLVDVVRQDLVPSAQWLEMIDSTWRPR